MRAANKSNELTSELPGVLTRTDTAPGKRDDSKDAKPPHTDILWRIIELRPGRSFTFVHSMTGDPNHTAM
jgi:hypothetical protein